MGELVSIVIPVYNAENRLNSCIERIRKQTYKNIEIILVDDGSTDDSLEICNHYAKEDARIRVFHTENKGPAHARKYGTKMARGGNHLC